MKTRRDQNDGNFPQMMVVVGDNEGFSNDFPLLSGLDFLRFGYILLRLSCKIVFLEFSFRLFLRSFKMEKRLSSNAEILNAKKRQFDLRTFPRRLSKASQTNCASFSFHFPITFIIYSSDSEPMSVAFPNINQAAKNLLGKLTAKNVEENVWDFPLLLHNLIGQIKIALT